MRLLKSTLGLSTGLSNITVILIVLALSCGVELTKSNLRSLTPGNITDVSRPPIYLPSSQHVRLVTMGYNNFVSHIIWFHTQSYFGKQLRSEQDFRWLYDMCKVMVELDSSAHHAFEFCATMLTWSTHQPNLSNQLLDQIIKLHSNHWYYLFLRGFNNLYFLQKPGLAINDLTQAAKLPDAPKEMLTSIVARLLISENDPIAAIEFLKRMVATTNNSTARQILTHRLKQAYLKRNLDNINTAITTFNTQYQSLPSTIDELIQSGTLLKIPPDPFGGHYIIDRNTGLASSSTGIRELEFSLPNTHIHNHNYEKSNE